MKYQARDKTLIEAVDLIEKRLVKTTGFSGKSIDSLTDYQRGIHIALREAQMLLRQEAKSESATS